MLFAVPRRIESTGYRWVETLRRPDECGRCKYRIQTSRLRTGIILSAFRSQPIHRGLEAYASVAECSCGSPHVIVCLVP